MNIFKKLKVTDYIIILLIIVLCVIGALAVLKKKNFSNLPVEKEVKVQFDVFFRGITLSTPEFPIKSGEDAFITIRNVPYTKLKIVAAQAQERMTYIDTPQGVTVAPDVAVPNLFDCIVRLEDTAKKTSDGYVAGGNKLKMGVPVVIEGEKYKYQGTISNIFAADEQPASSETLQNEENKE